MIIEQTTEQQNADYQIRELACSKEAGRIRLRWRYKQTSDFLVFFYDSRKEFDLKLACARLAAEGYSDPELAEQPKRLLSVDTDSCLKFAYIKHAEFQRDGRCFSFPANMLKKDLPYGICVFACVYDTQLHIFPAGTQHNVCYLPVRIKAEIRYKTKLFSKDKYCMLRLPYLEDYQDGCIRYYVEGVTSDFPLPQSCLGRELVIVIPRRAKVRIRVQEEYKKYYLPLA